MNHVSIRISGKVQGVYFRASTKEVAEKFGIKGFVQNERDGSVYVEAEGDEESLKQFVAWCHHGPLHAEVRHVDLREGIAQGFTGFDIRR
ncbi:MAG TPA: acylphosphatase [Cyclobacteriaceae bacterium]|nr:acylphosphatase [Cyclobacteriaceae bacterium]